jgi:site-specific recombinase XerD
MSSFDLSFLSNEAGFDVLLQEHIAERTSLRAHKTLREYRFFVRNFRRWWLDQGEPELTQTVILEWILHGVKRAKVKTMVVKVLALDHFLSFLTDKKLLASNPLSELRQGYRFLGYRGIVRELWRTGSVATVISMADYPFSGPLGPSCLAYLEFLAALGKRCDSHRYQLASLERFLRQHNISAWTEVNRALIEQWMSERKPTSAYQKRCWLLVLANLFRFLADRDEVAVSPVPPPGPHHRRSRPPRILSQDEVRAILNEAAKLPDHRLMPFRGQTYRMVFLTLYTLGLRGSEALNLRLGDIDFTQHSLTIGQTKFYKGRVLPFGPRYESALRAYIDAHPLLRSSSREAFLFPTDSQRTPRLANNSAFRTLLRIIDELGITTPAETRTPCLHSFRHSFAVHWIEQWLRDGVDVMTKLPLLSAFLGHVDAAATQVYLTMTPERLRLIGERFENAVGKKVQQ